MKEYWPKRLFRNQAADAAPPVDIPSASNSNIDLTDEYDRARLKRLQNVDSVDGWKTELQRYLNDPHRDVKKDTDTIKWWSVSAESATWLLARTDADMVPACRCTPPCTPPLPASPLTSSPSLPPR